MQNGVLGGQFSVGEQSVTVGKHFAFDTQSVLWFTKINIWLSFYNFYKEGHLKNQKIVFKLIINVSSDVCF